jgi:hypothetical protein
MHGGRTFRRVAFQAMGDGQQIAAARELGRNRRSSIGKVTSCRSGSNAQPGP